ncbi:hypothetical protein HNY73_002361 [Argiope bruennichi]|uniref:Uncharacterized protein n=1 Tax=Argiope bruennichi TaxID=94029 RepID=A0A8T0FZR0_ARGBR|nr:hypothetical protein HNY73_002361 [Argiope bruennichi]
MMLRYFEKINPDKSDASAKLKHPARDLQADFEQNPSRVIKHLLTAIKAQMITAQFFSILGDNHDVRLRAH